jgi:hypothetical protein
MVICIESGMIIVCDVMFDMSGNPMRYGNLACTSRRRQAKDADSNKDPDMGDDMVRLEQMRAMAENSVSLSHINIFQFIACQP